MMSGYCSVYSDRGAVSLADSEWDTTCVANRRALASNDGSKIDVSKSERKLDCR